jgi:hypothetical protein
MALPAKGYKRKPVARSCTAYGRLKESITLSPVRLGKSAMKTLWGIANPDQLAALKKLLEQYVEERGLKGDEAAIDRLANRIMNLFNDGVTDAVEIRGRLDSSSTSF